MEHGSDRDRREWKSLSNWTPRWFGFWADLGTGDDELPYRKDFEDDDCDSPTRDRVASFLRNAPMVLASSMWLVPCPICGASEFDPGGYRSDGEWLWPDSLAHEVKAHSVRVPDQFFVRMEELHFSAPALPDDLNVDDLEWPS